VAEEQKPKKTAEEVAADVAKTEAETTKLRAEAKKAEAEALKAQLEADEQACDLEVALLALAKMKEKDEREKLDDKYRHVYQFVGEVNEAKCTTCIKELTYWHRKDPGCRIEVIFNTPGGSVIDGMALFDYITFLRAQDHEVVTMCVGMAASMGGILLQAGTVRRMTRESYVLIHEIAFGAIGSMGKVEDQVEFGHKIQKRVIDIFVQRSNLTKAKFVKNWQRKDWWLDSDECLKLGIVDEVV